MKKSHLLTAAFMIIVMALLLFMKASKTLDYVKNEGSVEQFNYPSE